jgi:hypothetical protein
VLDGFLPLRAFKGEERFGSTFGNRGQLEKIACNDQLWSMYANLASQKQELSSNVPGCRRTAVLGSSAASGQSKTGYRISSRPPWILYSDLFPHRQDESDFGHPPSSMIKTLVVLHRPNAGLHVRIRFICLSRSVCPGVTAPQEWTVVPTKRDATKSGDRPAQGDNATKGPERQS